MSEDTLVLVPRSLLLKLKPIVGAAVAGSSNKARPIRQKVYEELERVIQNGEDGRRP